MRSGSEWKQRITNNGRAYLNKVSAACQVRKHLAGHFPTILTRRLPSNGYINAPNGAFTRRVWIFLHPTLCAHIEIMRELSKNNAS